MNTCKYVKSSEKELSDTTFMAITETDMQYIEHKTFGMTPVSYTHLTLPTKG